MDSPAQQIKDRLNIVEVVSQYVQLRKAGRSHIGKCPFHKEKTPSFHVSPERGTYKCFGCGEGGDVFSFLQKMEGTDFPTVLKQLAKRAGVKLEERFIPKQKDKGKEERLHEALEEATLFFEGELKKRPEILTYLHSRGVKDETITSWQLGYAPPTWEGLTSRLIAKGFLKEEIVEAGLAIKSEKKMAEVYDRFRGRIMFPMADAGGSIVAFSGRFFEKVSGSREEGEPAKYVNSPETVLFKKSRVLYGLDRAKNFIRKADCILLVEGQFDLILTHQSGLPYTVALSGTALTHEHLTLLSRLSKRLVLALDADEAGIRAGLKSSLMAITAGFDVKIPTLLGGKDPADLAKDNPELLKAAIRTSATAVEFFLEVLRKGSKDERAYKKAVEAQVLPLIQAIGSSIDQEHFVRIVAARLGVSETAVRTEVGKVRVSATQTPEDAVVQVKNTEAPLSQLERAAGMLIFYFEKDQAVSARLAELLGNERVAEYKERLMPQAETLRFRFESEVGEHADEATIAGDMFKQIEIMVVEEQIAASGADARKMTELIRRKHELQK